MTFTFTQSFNAIIIEKILKKLKTILNLIKCTSAVENFILLQDIYVINQTAYSNRTFSMSF